MVNINNKNIEQLNRYKRIYNEYIQEFLDDDMDNNVYINNLKSHITCADYILLLLSQGYNKNKILRDINNLLLQAKAKIREIDKEIKESDNKFLYNAIYFSYDGVVDALEDIKAIIKGKKYIRKN